ncbi:MAG TPA: SGNH/GDSL hydrolase family protein [Xanthobacteraceae bacterium]|nr:SGNH/GDSL hydrolase family protein [Xanthobacteraceae bacterium]
MKTIVGLVALVSLVAAGETVAQMPAPVTAVQCEVQPELLTSESHLNRVTNAVRADKKLDVLIIGSLSSTLPGADGADRAYPARFAAAMRQRLPNETIVVGSEILPRVTAEDVAPRLAALVQKHHSVLAIWQTGTADALQSVSPDDFREALDEGIKNLQGAGVDVVLLNPQYSPRLETMISLGPYLDNMRVVAQQHDIPLFDRFAIMKHWSETGTFDLHGAVRGTEMAKNVHDCLGRALAAFVVDAAGLKASSGKFSDP